MRDKQTLNIFKCEVEMLEVTTNTHTHAHTTHTTDIKIQVRYKVRSQMKNFEKF